MGGKRLAYVPIDCQQLSWRGDKPPSPLFPSSDIGSTVTIGGEQVPYLWTPPVPSASLAMASEETAGAAPPGEGKDGRPGSVGLNPGVPIRGIRMKFAVLTGLVEVGEVSNRDIVETVFNLVSWLWGSE